jgi:polyphosphate kinase
VSWTRGAPIVSDDPREVAIEYIRIGDTLRIYDALDQAAPENLVTTMIHLRARLDELMPVPPRHWHAWAAGRRAGWW